MKDYLLQIAETKSTPSEKLNSMREYLQAYILRLLQEKGYFRCLAFLGGTALRFLYNLPRFSEDIDFSLHKRERYDFPKLLRQIEDELELATYKISISYNDHKNVHSAFFRFPELMYQAGISPHLEQKLSIRLEIDTNPPEGAVTQTHLVNRHFPLVFLHYDLPSLLAGKVNAILSRPFEKGRDYYDLIWYLSRWPEIKPNFHLLNAGLAQVGWKGPIVDKRNWRQILKKYVKKVDWPVLMEDVHPFLENPKDLESITKENFLGLL